MMVQVHIISKEGQMTSLRKLSLREFDSMLINLGVTDEINLHEAYNTQSENGELAPLF